MLRFESLDGEVREYVLNSVRGELGTLDALVADVQSAVAVEREDFGLETRPVPLQALLGEAEKFGRSVSGERPFAVVADGSLEGRAVIADPERVAQVLRNLISNAVKYSPAGSPIELRTKPGEPGRVRFEVADEGRGISPEDLDRVFEKFGRGRGAGGGEVKGVGLGLYISRRLAQPTEQSSRSPPSPIRAPSSASGCNWPRKKRGREKVIRLMLVDDHASAREPLAFMLDHEEDMTVVAKAGSVAEAREALAENLDLDVAILDLGLPDGSGKELVGAVYASNPRAVALVLTSFSDRRVLAEAIEAGAAGVMHKSSDVQEILAAVRKLHAGEQLVSAREVSEAIRLAVTERRGARASGSCWTASRTGNARCSRRSPKASRTRKSPNTSFSARAPCGPRQQHPRQARRPLPAAGRRLRRPIWGRRPVLNRGSFLLYVFV